MIFRDYWILIFVLLAISSITLSKLMHPLSKFSSADFVYTSNNYKFELTTAKSSNRNEKCTPTVKLQRCNTEESSDAKWQWNRSYSYHVLAQATKSCKGSTFSYKWKLTKPNGKVVKVSSIFKNKDFFIFSSYALEAGLYYLHVVVSENESPGISAKVEHGQRVDYIDAKPTAIIDYGEKTRYDRSDQDVLVRGDRSLDNHFALWENVDLRYEWSCTADPPNKFCSIESKANSIIIPAQYARTGTEYKISLKVTAGNNKSDTASQLVRIYRQTGSISIKCMKNCEGVINNNIVIYLHSACSSCSNVKYSLEWIIQPWPISQNRPSIAQYGLNNPKFIIKPLTLRNNFDYLVTVNYYNSSINDYRKALLGKATLNLTTSDRPDGGSCSIEPTTGGSSTKTKFTLTCWGFNHTKPLIYRVYYETENRNKFFLAWGDSKPLEFYLPGYRQPQLGYVWTDWNYRTIYVDAFDADGLQTIDTVSVIVAVNNSYSSWSDIENIVNGSNTNFTIIENALKDGKIDEACQAIFVVSQELRMINKLNKKNRTGQLDIQIKILEALNSCTIKNSDEVLIIATAAKHINEEYNITVATLTSELALKLAKTQFEFIEKCSTRLRQEIRSKQILYAIVEITSKFKKYMRNEFSKENFVFNVQDYFPPMKLKVISEEYPNYDDAQFASVNLVSQYTEIVDNLEEANRYAGHQYAFSLAPGELPKEIEIVLDNKQVAKYFVASNTGVGFSSEKFSIDGGTKVLPSKGVETFGDKEVYAVVIKYDSAPYWWLNTEIFSEDKLLMQTFYTSNNKFEDLKSHTEQIYTTETAGLAYHKDSVSMPPKSQWTENIVETQMNVHRICIQKGSGVIIKFAKLNNNKLRVTLKYNSRPTYADVQNYTIVSSSMDKLLGTIPNSEINYGHAWLYVAVLPDFGSKRAVANNPPVKYEVGFTSPSCLYFDLKKNHSWVQGPCTVGPEMEEHKLHCLCTGQGQLGFQYVPVLYKRDPYFEPPVTMAISPHSMMMFLIFYVFACYCIALCFAIGSTWRFVYFASDNIVAELYGYLIVIKTGDMEGAGTTSNIGIKIFGKERRSRSHVVNYPDPNKYLMQRGNQDCIVITTESYLGDIKQIYVWHDSVGLEPSWYCEWIRIKDLQSHKEWFFSVNEWFCVVHGKANFVRAEPTSEKQIKVTGCNSWFRKFALHFRFFHTWNIFRRYQGYDLTYVERLTLILSAIYTTTLFTMAVYGTPELTVYDSYGSDHFKFTSMIIFYGVLAAIPAFLFHLVFTILFRTKNYNIFRVVSFDLVWLGWVLITIHIVLCMIFLVQYAIWVAFVTGIEILLSILVGLLTSIFILESIYIICKLRRTKVPNIQIPPEKVVSEIENQRSALYPMFGNNLLLPYLTDKYRPLTREEWLQKRQKEKARDNITRRSFDFIKILIFLILLFFLVYISRRSLDVYSNMKMREMASGYFTKEPRFHNIETLEDFINYLNKTLAIVTGPTKWYSNFNLVNPGIMIDYCTKILGVVKVRQLRVCQDCCDLVYPVKHINWTCNPEYEPRYSIKGKFMEFWEPYVDDFPTTTFRPSARNNIGLLSDEPVTHVRRMMSSWIYEDEPIPTKGYITTYPGGGYSAPLGRHVYNTYYNIKYLEKSQWMDTKSRAVFIEFITYNPNYNVFNGVKLVLEESASGLWVKTYQIDTLRILFVNNEPKIMFSIIFPAFVIIIFLVIVFYLNGMFERYAVFWKNSWNYFDFILIVLCVCCIYYYYEKATAIDNFVERVGKAQHNEIVYYDSIVKINHTLLLLVGLLVCLATIRLWRLLKFGKKFAMMEQTFSYSAKPLTALVICHIILVFVYTCVGYVVFIPEYREFRNFLQSFSTVILLTTRFPQSFDIAIVDNDYPRFVYFYYISYIFATFLILVLYIAVIAISYHKVRNKNSNLKVYYTARQFARDRSRFEMENMKRKIYAARLRMRGGAEASEVLEKKIRAKANEHRYAHLMIITSYKLSCMRFIAKSIIINKYRTPTKTQVSKSRRRLIDKVVFLVLSRNRQMLKKEYVYVAIDAKHRPQVVRDDRIVEMEYISDYVVNSGTRINSIKAFFDKIVIIKKGGKEEEEEESTIDKVDSVEEFEDRIDVIIDELHSILKIMNNIRVVELQPNKNDL